jgi:hypothetical protein
MYSIVVASLFVLSFGSGALAFYSNTPIVDLTSQNFGQVFEDTSVWMVNFIVLLCFDVWFYYFC